jgi:hypothetical protein
MSIHYLSPERSGQSQSWQLNAALLGMVRRAFEMLEEEGLVFEGLPTTFENLDALQMLDGLALAVHEAVERHAPMLPPQTFDGLQAAMDVLWRASAVSEKVRAIAETKSGPTLNDVAEVALLAATAGEVFARRGNRHAGGAPAGPSRERQIEAARAARAARVRAKWELEILQHCQERLSRAPNMDSAMLAANVCARAGLDGGVRQQVVELIRRWRSNGALQPGRPFRRA